MAGMMYYIGDDGGSNNTPLIDRILKAIDYYNAKYQDQPSVILFNDQTLERVIKAPGSERLTSLPDIELRGYGNMVNTDIVWIGHI